MVIKIISSSWFLAVKCHHLASNSSKLLYFMNINEPWPDRSGLQRWVTTKLLSDLDALLSSSFLIALVNGISYGLPLAYILRVSYSVIYPFQHPHFLNLYISWWIFQESSGISPWLRTGHWFLCTSQGLLSLTEFASSSGVFAGVLNLNPSKVLQVNEFLFIQCYIPTLFIKHS